ncbi:hypothetical protein LTR48_003077 [Friedmanniomyces endolithicus]|uniref:Uncharacterized protein n=1 Tax=Rachicladosporium monterosium TaxID=1507873 RepID=A0ABR0L925_9PEZI|nr:hypothetical protein LTS09_004236 [Friedmanniomyces endolithicus]KAK0942218.1 hypothetical protein LTR29_006299 [Friedmanniomyces endolithicus]KAK1093061.1 hypothetical protein LTR48_003077 [Friedmanniomyces endolithicus]KAK5145332.1 hypothetical protein LTR32_002900 [Rachicladosporium monterosium]
MSQYILPDDLVHLPEQGVVQSDTQDVDLLFTWSNDPSFSFTVLRKSTGDVLFDTRGSVLVYENQFIEFVSQLPQDYNLYGMGEQIHNLRLGNNYTTTFYAADAGDPIDGNIYGLAHRPADGTPSSLTMRRCTPYLPRDPLLRSRRRDRWKDPCVDNERYGERHLRER